MRYISTRGEAPPLGFVEVTLAGLARDGGLYVPESWPQLDARAIQNFAGRPYAEVAVEVIRPFVGDAIPEHDLARMAREAYGNFRHPAVAPLTQYGANEFMLELFHGPTLAFKDLAMQLLGRLMDHVLTARGERTTVVVATSGDTGGAAVEAFRGSSRADVFVLFPQGRISDVQRRMMTTAEDDNVHALAIEGTFDDCQAIVKGLFNHHGFRDQVSLSGVNSINWARIVAQAVYYFTAAVALGAPHRKVAFTVPTGNFGDIYAGYVAMRMGLPVDRLVIATNVNDILARTLATGAYEPREVIADHLAVDGHPGCLQFRAHPVRCRRPRRQGGARHDGLARAVAPLRAVGPLAFGAARDLRRQSRRRAGNRRRHPHRAARDRALHRSPYRGRRRGGGEGDARPGRCPMVVSEHRACREIPRRRAGRLRARGRRCPTGSATCTSVPNGSRRLPVDQGAVERHILSLSRAAREGAAA